MPGICAEQQGEWECMANSMPRPKCWGVWEYYYIKAMACGKYVHLCLSCMTLIQKMILFIPRLPEPFFVTCLPKGGGYHPLPRFSLLSLRFLWFWYWRIGMSLFFPLIQKSTSTLHLTSRWRFNDVRVTKKWIMPGICAEQQGEWECMANSMPRPKCWGVWEYYFIKAITCGKYVHLCLSCMTLIQKMILFIPRLPEPFFVTCLPKGGGYHPLPRFSLLSLRFLWFWYWRIGMSLFFPLIQKSTSSPSFDVTMTF